MSYQKTRTPEGVQIGGNEELRSALDGLKEVVDKIDPEGNIYTFIYKKGEGFSPLARLARNLLDVEWIYSIRRIQQRPDMIEEYKELMEAVDTINKIVKKRRAAIAKARKK